MNDLQDLGNYFASQAFFGSAIVICISITLLVVIKKYLIKKVAYTSKAEQKQNTFIGVIFNLLQYVVVLVCAVLVLQFHGVNVTSIIAGLGIVGAMVGLALQDTMKDVISGINIYNNNFYKVGDLVNYNGNLCEVKYFSARVTKFASLYTGNTFTVCNSTINSIEKVKRNSMVMMYFDFATPKKLVDECFEIACAKTTELDFCTRVDNFGLGDISDTGVLFIAKIVCEEHPNKILMARAVFMQSIVEECSKRGISPNFNDERKVVMIGD